jgi:predicted nucleic acid-binding protein
VKLIDTSSWVHALRRNGDPEIRARVKALLEAGEAAWCPMVRLELWNGVGSEGDRKSLRALEDVLPDLPVTEDVWQTAVDLADRCRRAGKTTPIQDVLITACARHHRVDIEHDDAHFSWLLTL